MTKEQIIEQIIKSLNEYKGFNEGIDDASFYIADEFDKIKETLYTEEQVREAMKFARTFNSAIRDIDYIKSLKQGGDK